MTTLKTTDKRAPTAMDIRTVKVSYTYYEHSFVYMYMYVPKL